MVGKTKNRKKPLVVFKFLYCVSDFNFCEHEWVTKKLYLKGVINVETWWAIAPMVRLVSYWLDAFFADFSSIDSQ
jgi:hypothetical protein